MRLSREEILERIDAARVTDVEVWRERFEEIERRKQRLLAEMKRDRNRPNRTEV